MPSDTNKKIIVSYASAGGGHKAVAEAIKEALIKLDPSVKIEVIDILNFTSKLFKFFYASGYLFLANRAKYLWGFLYSRKEDVSFVSESNKFSRLVMRILARRFISYIKEINPDAFIFTHFLPSKIVQDIKERDKLQFKTGVVVTDYGNHSIWLTPGTDFYFVATEQLKIEMVHFLNRLKMRQENIIVSGIPVRMKFLEPINREQVRDKLGLSIDCPVISFIMGIVGMRRILEILKYLTSLEVDFQLILLVGKDEELKRKVKEYFKDKEFPYLRKILIYGMVGNMNEILSVSDLVITKSGGIITSETISMGAPMVFIENYPGQEERNVDYFLEEGTGIKINQLSSIKYKIESLLKDRDRLKGMKENVEKIAKPAASLRIAEVILNEVKKC
ncbi:MAG: glycosyltransferase [Acidobacteriota bacterium]